MNGLRWRPITAAALALAVSLACGGDGDGPTIVPVAGTFVLSLTTPNADDGAVLFSVSGGAITDAAAASASNVLFFRSTGATSINAVVLGDIGEGPAVTIDVPNVAALSSYSATIDEVADRNNDLKSSLSGYSFTIQPE